MQQYTLNNFLSEFPDDAACLEWLVQSRWPDGIFCKPCDRVTPHHPMRTRRSYSCDYCGHHIHPAAGTIFHKSRTSLHKWFYAIYLMSQTRGGISAKQIEREVGVTYKTAWRMFHKIRSMLSFDGDDPLGGEVEADETYVGGRRRGTPSGRPGPTSHKTAVFGVVERGGRVMAVTVPNVRRVSLMPHIKKHVLPSTMMYTDELSSYNTLAREGFGHERVNHSEAVYVAGTAHVNTIEGFWSLVKRGISGVYHSVSSKHLQLCLDEYSFRYNHRDDETPMFKTFLSQVLQQAA